MIHGGNHKVVRVIPVAAGVSKWRGTWQALHRGQRRPPLLCWQRCAGNWNRRCASTYLRSASRPVAQLPLALLGRAVGTAIDGAVAFDPVADDPDVAVGAAWGTGLNRALEAVEGHGAAIAHHLEGLVVVVAALIADCHEVVSFCSRLCALRRDQAVPAHTRRSRPSSTIPMSPQKKMIRRRRVRRMISP